MTHEIFARLAPLPAKVKAVVVTDDYMVFTIFVSEYLCEDSRRKALIHELEHIYDNHFTNEIIPIAQLEQLADQIGKSRQTSSPPPTVSHQMQYDRYIL